MKGFAPAWPELAVETGALKGLRKDRCASHLFRLLLLHIGVRRVVAVADLTLSPIGSDRRVGPRGVIRPDSNARGQRLGRRPGPFGRRGAGPRGRDGRASPSPH